MFCFQVSNSLNNKSHVAYCRRHIFWPLKVYLGVLAAVLGTLATACVITLRKNIGLWDKTTLGSILTLLVHLRCDAGSVEGFLTFLIHIMGIRSLFRRVLVRVLGNDECMNAESDIRHIQVTGAWCICCLSFALHLWTPFTQCCKNLSAQTVWDVAPGCHTPPWVTALSSCPTISVMCCCTALSSLMSQSYLSLNAWHLAQHKQLLQAH